MSNTTDIDSIRTITLNITNPERLQLGCIARRQFDRRGGTIGSEAACWQLVDVDHQVAPVCGIDFRGDRRGGSDLGQCAGDAEGVGVEIEQHVAGDGVW